MKKLVVGFFMALLLVGCGHEETPEYYFDMVLTEIESASSIETELKITDQDENEWYQGSYKNGNLVENWTAVETDESFIENIKQIACFYYGDTYKDFALDNQVVSCKVLVEDSPQITQTAKIITGQDVQRITQYMYLENESIDYVELIVETKTKTLIYHIDLRDLEME